jgi:hypothetical protein
MNAKVEDWGEQQFGLQLALGSDEIDRLIKNLGVLQKDPEQHFHISAHGPHESRLGDIEVSTLAANEAHNMRLTSVALAPGMEIPDARKRGQGFSSAPVRVLVIWAMWTSGLYTAFEATFRAYASFATNDYRPILIRGVWACGLALTAFHGTAVLSNTWKARLPGIIAALLLLVVLGELLRRLSA